MNHKRLLTIAVVSMLLVGGLAALGAAAPADQANDAATDAHDGNAPDDVGPEDRAADGVENADDAGPGNADGVGPSDGLPEQAPDHVSEIHDRIDSFLSGSIDDLGDSLGELLGGGEAADDAASDNADDASDDEGADDGDTSNADDASNTAEA